MTETQDLDLSTALYSKNPTYLPSNIVSDIYVDWGDGRLIIDHTDGSDKDILKHTYKNPDVYVVKLYGTFKWFTCVANPWNEDEGTPDELRHHLTQINVPDICPIKQFCGTGRPNDQGFAFAKCVKLTKVSGDLTNNLSDTAENQSCFARFFWRCHELSDVNPLVLHYPTTMDYVDLRGVFNSSGLLHAPGDIFNNIPKNCTKLTLGDLFWGALKLESIDEEIFANLPEREDGYTFKVCFSGCRSLTTIPPNLFSKIPNSSNVSFDSTFLEDTGITGDVPRLWETHPDTIHNSCFYGCTNASNYAEIPDDWKQQPAEETLNLDFAAIL